MSYARYYTGIGSREVPDNIFYEMKLIAEKMSQDLFVLRSGGATGSDTAFQIGAGANTEIYLPWNNFNGMDDSDGTHVNAKSLHNYEKAKYIASMHHPAWDKLSQGAVALHTRNAYQVLGFELDNPSQVLICWAEPAGIKSVKGGTNTAVSIAHQYGVPVYNLFFQSDLNALKKILRI